MAQIAAETRRRATRGWLAVTGLAILACIVLLGVVERGDSSPAGASGSTDSTATPPETAAPPRASAPPLRKGEGPSGSPDVRTAPASPRFRRPSASQPASPARIEISLTHRLSEGGLEVLLDGSPILRESFTKAKLAIVQTTSWEAFSVPSGSHRVTASVTAPDGRMYRADSVTVNLEPGKAASLRIGFKGDGLTIRERPAS